MQASIKIIKARNKKKLEYDIVVELYGGNKKRPRLTIGKTLPVFWDNRNNEPYKQHPDYYYLIPIVKDYQSKCAKVNFGQYTFDQAHSIIFSNIPKKKHENGMLLDFFDTLISEKKVKKQSYRNFTDVKGILTTYFGENNDIPINDITYEWLNAFMLHKLSNQCNLGGVMSYFRTLRTVYKEAQRRTSLKIKQDNPFLGIIKEPTPKPVIELSKEDLKKLFNFKPNKSTTVSSNKKMLRNIDLFMFQFYIGGIDYVDIARLTWDQIESNRIKLQRYKLRNKRGGGPKINNWLSPSALNIIAKHGDKTTSRIFSFIPNPETNEREYLNFQGNLNRSFNSITKTLGITKISSKSPRYLFRTYAGELLIHDLIIMSLQGHKPEGISYRYQGSIVLTVQDEAHGNIIKL